MFYTHQGVKNVCTYTYSFMIWYNTHARHCSENINRGECTCGSVCIVGISGWTCEYTPSHSDDNAEMHNEFAWVQYGYIRYDVSIKMIIRRARIAVFAAAAEGNEKDFLPPHVCESWNITSVSFRHSIARYYTTHT